MLSVMIISHADICSLLALFQASEMRVQRIGRRRRADGDKAPLLPVLAFILYHREACSLPVLQSFLAAVETAVETTCQPEALVEMALPTSLEYGMDALLRNCDQKDACGAQDTSKI